MKSLNRAGQFTLNGKKTKLMSCRCCVIVNFKSDYDIRLAKKEINRFIKTQDRDVK